METAVKKNLYEAMFMVDSGEAASDWVGVNKTIETMLERADAEIVSIRKWDERRLAYKITHKERGTYILCYFRAEGDKIEGIERDVQLSERVMRVLILNAEHMTQDDIEKDTPAIAVEKRQQAVVDRAKEAAQPAAESTKPKEESPDRETVARSLAKDVDAANEPEEPVFADEDQLGDEQSELDDEPGLLEPEAGEGGGESEQESGGTDSEKEPQSRP